MKNSTLLPFGFAFSGLVALEAMNACAPAAPLDDLAEQGSAILCNDNAQYDVRVTVPESPVPGWHETVTSSAPSTSYPSCPASGGGGTSAAGGQSGAGGGSNGTSLPGFAVLFNDQGSVGNYHAYAAWGDALPTTAAECAAARVEVSVSECFPNSNYCAALFSQVYTERGIWSSTLGTCSIGTISTPTFADSVSAYRVAAVAYVRSTGYKVKAGMVVE